MVKFSKIDDNEFSRVLPATRLAQLPITVEISADRRDCAALALRFKLMDIASLTARLTIMDDAKPGQVLVKGRLEAALTQACVVTLQPLEAQLAEGFEATFALGTALAATFALGTTLGATFAATFVLGTAWALAAGWALAGLILRLYLFAGVQLSLSLREGIYTAKSQKKIAVRKPSNASLLIE